MDPKEIHEKATSILAKALDLSYDQAITFIEKECADNDILKEEVLALYNEINEEDTQPEIESISTTESKKNYATNWSEKL